MSDKIIVCEDCGQEFAFTVGEPRWTRFLFGFLEVIYDR